ncbi:Lysosome-associated membrane glycoprotein 3 [Collichthys lucidus]|uniref:Lysosome-associated membrane glycoprotein 3 n=1 Tax=Collichthys lucidus TaxID=240159 RepID=A0A4U5UHP9_COLLU|nr:Lysosome-associated membrane glycoprotein 3 [Collichthys lucidus]
MGGWSLIFLAIISGVYLQRNDSSVQPASDSEPPSEAQVYRPILQPSEAIPPIGTYVLENKDGKCYIKTTLGAEFIVIEKKRWYFSLDPSRVTATGYCGRSSAVLSLTLPDNSASLQFTFVKDKKVFYVSKLTVKLTTPVCKECANKNYSGVMDHEKLFKTANGQSFNCKSENLFLTSSQLWIKLVPLQMQAFSLSKGQYGKEVECWADFNKRVIPIVIGATVVGILLIALLTYLMVKDRRRQGYDRL